MNPAQQSIETKIESLLRLADRPEEIYRWI